MMGRALRGGSALCFVVVAVVAASCVGNDSAGSGADGGSGADSGVTKSDGGGGDSGGGTLDGSSGGGDGSASDGGTDSGLPPHVATADAYLKTTFSHLSQGLGGAIAISQNGNVLVVGAQGEASAATGVNNTNPGPTDTSKSASGAAYVYRRAASGTWSQEAYLKASDPAVNAHFGKSVAITPDGNLIAVGAPDDPATVADSGAVYVYRYAGGAWGFPTKLKAQTPVTTSQFGSSVAFSGDSNTLAVGSMAEASFAGAAYVFGYSGGNWTQSMRLQPSNNAANNRFGWSVTLSGDGTELVVGAIGEASSATGISATASTDTSLTFAGAAYVFAKSGSSWNQATYIKPAFMRSNADFGQTVALSQDGNTLLVASPGEASSSKGVNGNQNDATAASAGAGYVFTKGTGGWTQSAYLKASNAAGASRFGIGASLSIDGTAILLGAPSEASAATGVNDTTIGQSDTSVASAGAAYLFIRTATSWTQTSYMKSNFAHADNFGIGVAVANGGLISAAGGSSEPSSATGINGNPNDTGAAGSGAAFTFK